MLEKILHRYVVIDETTKVHKLGDWIDVSNLTLEQVNKISKSFDEKYQNNWYLEIKRVED